LVPPAKKYILGYSTDFAKNKWTKCPYSKGPEYRSLFVDNVDSVDKNGKKRKCAFRFPPRNQNHPHPPEVFFLSGDCG
jgi:hypothetical protein